MPQATRDRLRQRFLDAHSTLVPPAPRGRSGEGPRAHRFYTRTDERAIGYVPYAKGELPDPLPATLVAFYLPQFHTIPENDEWWGKGFTEWRNVTRALPQFEGHVQPRLPGDLGFYDLRDTEVMREQARLAREYGIGAFCFYFYWFGGKTLLEDPLRNWLDDPTIDFPFCLCWANENWTRRWDGRAEEILIGQVHGDDDDIAFITYLAPYLRDQRYLRIGGNPLVLVYRPGVMPHPTRTVARWRAWCRGSGIGEIHVAYVQSFESPDPASLGFDSAVEFPPNRVNGKDITAKQRLLNSDFEGQVLDWRSMASRSAAREAPSYQLHPGINVGWDNEPRRPGKGRSHAHASPRGYQDWLSAILKGRIAGEGGERFVFVNAWNEWAEGAVLEPDAGLGYAWLDKTRRALQSQAAPASTSATSQPCVVVHAWHEEAFGEILGALLSSGVEWRIVVTTAAAKLDWVEARLSSAGLRAEIHAGENRGRDILPFLRIADTLLDEGVDHVLKLHTKKSEHLRNGDLWRKELVGMLLDPDEVQSALAAFAGEKRLGLIGVANHMLDLDTFMGGNRDAVDFLLTRIGAQRPATATFPSGSMFWVRLPALRPLLDANLRPGEFEAETGQQDGTLAHAVERVLGLCVETEGFLIRRIGLAASERGLKPTYPYAAPSP